MRDLRVTLVQQELVWEDAPANREHFQTLLEREKPATDLVLLPEMFTTGFTMNGEAVAEPAGGDTERWMQRMASALDCAVAGSVVTRDVGGVFNRMLFVTPQSVTVYDKRHLFRMAGEHEHYAPGRERVVLEWRDWRIKPEICYDLRFPVFSRNLNDYDLLLNVANWPAPRAHHWRALLRARAIENLACVVGLNRIGRDGNGHDYLGDSMAIDQAGTVLCDLESRSAVQTVIFGAAALNSYRETFPTPMDADVFTLRL